MCSDIVHPVRTGRGFVELADAQMHYRHAGTRVAGGHAPAVLVHASPASALGLAPLMSALARDRWVVAPDTLGNGDSIGPIPEGADVDFFATRLAQTLDGLGIERFDLYGTHTGASIATAFALRYPARVKSLVLDGVGLYPPEMQAELLARYAPALAPDLQGTTLMWVWHFVRDTFMFWPWYRLDRGGRRDGGLPPPHLLHTKVVEVLKAVTTYHHPYRAAIAYDKRSHIPGLAVPTIAVCAREDMLQVFFDELLRLVPGGRGRWIDGIHSPEAAAATAQVLREFFDSH